MNLSTSPTSQLIFDNNQVDNYYWIFFTENNPKRFLLILLVLLSLLQIIELVKSFISSSWTRKKLEKTITTIRLKLLAGASSSVISLILTSAIWFQYRLHEVDHTVISANGLMRLELFMDLTVTILTLLAQFLTIEIHSSLLSQETKRASLYAHYLMVILINILSGGVVFNCMMNFHTNALQLINSMS